MMLLGGLFLFDVTYVNLTNNKITLDYDKNPENQ
jgi:hypothetical protein